MQGRSRRGRSQSWEQGRNPEKGCSVSARYCSLGCNGVWNGEGYEDKGVVFALGPGRLLKVTHWSPMGDTEGAPENYQVVT